MTDDARNEYIKQTACRLGIDLPPDELMRVIAVFGNLERAAALVAMADLPDDTIAAGVFRPQGTIAK